MKKQLLLAGLLVTFGATAQTTVTFEDLSLDTAVYWSGSDSSGFFVSGGVTFPNEYNHEWGYWSGGFIYSRSTDVTTAGYTNDFSAYTGGGANGSSIYAVNYGANIDFGSEQLVSSIAITNTTYAALSMLNGDFFGKVFGSPNNAQGQPDGTNGEDYFRLLITGYDSNNDSVGQVVFYLADYRFADNAQDYIVATWETVDLTPLGAIQYLDFALESSDVGANGMNTPAYFALDDLVYTNAAAGIASLPANALRIYPNPVATSVTIEGMEGTVHVRQTDGKLVYSGSTNGLMTLSCADWTAGHYLVEVSGEAGIARTTLIKL